MGEQRIQERKTNSGDGTESLEDGSTGAGAAAVRQPLRRPGLLRSESRVRDDGRPAALRGLGARARPYGDPRLGREPHRVGQPPRRGAPRLVTRDRSGALRPTPWWDWDDIVDLDYSSPALRQYMTEAMVHWVRVADVEG